MFKILGKVLIFWLSTQSMSAGASEIRVLFDDASAPLMSVKAGKVEGIYPDIVRAVLKAAGTSAQFEGVPWGRALAEARSGKAWAGGAVRTPEREREYAFSEPLYEERVVAFVAKGKSEIRSFRDLKGKVVGSNRGWSHGADWDRMVQAKEIVVDEADSATANIQRLKAGRIDVYVTVQEDGELAVASLGFREHIVTGSVTLAQNSTHLIFSKSKVDPSLLKKLDESILTLRKTGRIREIAASAQGLKP